MDGDATGSCERTGEHRLADARRPRDQNAAVNIGPRDRASAVIAEIPPYVEGRNIRCIESVIRKMAGILNLKINLDDLRATSDELEKKLNEIVEQRPVLAKPAPDRENNPCTKQDDQNGVVPDNTVQRRQERHESLRRMPLVRISLPPGWR